MELSKEVAFLAELLISLDGGEEVRMLVFEGAPTAIEKGSGEAQIVGKTEGGRDLEGVEIVRMHPIDMYDIAVALKLNNFIIIGCMGCHATHAQRQQQDATFQEIS